jgi:hypothetical protein
MNHDFPKSDYISLSYIGYSITNKNINKNEYTSAFFFLSPFINKTFTSLDGNFSAGD